MSDNQRLLAIAIALVMALGLFALSLRIPEGSACNPDPGCTAPVVP